MAKQEITMPRFGAQMVTGKILEIYVKPGDHVEEDAPLMKVKTSKADSDVEALWTGTITEITAEIDGEYEPGAVLGYMEEDD